MSIKPYKGGGWEYRWRTPDGKSRRKWYARKEDAERKETEVRHSKLTGSYIDLRAGQMSFREYAEEWRGIQAHHRDSTAGDVERQLRLHIYPHIGDRPIAAVRPSEVQALVRALTGHLAPSTIEVVYKRVVAVFAAAVRDRIMSVSPCTGIKLPRKPPASTLQLLTTDQVVDVADAINARYRALVLLGAGSGLRPAELFGLTVDRVDFLRRGVLVDRQMSRAGQLAPPKSDSSYRTVPLADVTLLEVAEHLTRWPVADNGLVFTSQRGEWIRHPSFFMIWDSAKSRSGIPGWATPHHLRHYYASLLITKGASVKVVQARLGHASSQTTLDIYGHLWPDEEDTTRLVVEAELGQVGFSPRVADVSQGAD